MKYKKFLMLTIFTLMLLLGFRYTLLYKTDSFKGILINAATLTPKKVLPQYTTEEKRGTPSYDYILGSDGLPHFRVFFWVPKDATDFVPYAKRGINTNVSLHGPVGKWNVVTTNKVKDNLKLVFIYVPKTFVILYGKGFQKVIHLKYQINTKVIPPKA